MLGILFSLLLSPPTYNPPPQTYVPPPSVYVPPPRPYVPQGCRNGVSWCGQGNMCDSCYNAAVRPMGYAGVNRNAPPPAAGPIYCQPVVQCPPRWPWC